MLLCRIFGHKWEQCRCRRCGAVRDADHQWNGCVCRICGKKRDEAHDWNGCKCRKCGKIRDEGHDWDGCKCRICGKVREEGHQPDKELLMKSAKWAYHGAVLQPWKDTAVRCRACGKTIADLKRDRSYCPNCFCEIERQYVPSDEPTLLKYRFACKNCSYDKTVSISDGY